MSFVFRDIELPEHLEESLRAYANDGRPTGDFLQRCIENNLSRAVSYADDESLKALPAVVGWLYNEAPMQCWGKPGSFKNWIERKHAEREKQGVL